MDKPIKRYDEFSRGVDEDDDGIYVMYDDYVELEEENKELNQTADFVNEQLIEANQRIADLINMYIELYENSSVQFLSNDIGYRHGVFMIKIDNRPKEGE